MIPFFILKEKKNPQLYLFTIEFSGCEWTWVYICVCVCVPLNACVLFVCIVHSHTSGYVCSATPLVFVWRPAGWSPKGTCSGSFPGQTAATLPELAQYQTLHWNVVGFIFFFSPFVFLSPFLCFCLVLLLFSPKFILFVSVFYRFQLTNIPV